MPASVRHKEVIRGKILYYLALIYPRAATLPLLQADLDIFGFPVPSDELSYHVAYLVEKGLASADESRAPVPRRKIPLVEITAKGIDYYDGRQPADSGVYSEAN